MSTRERQESAGLPASYLLRFHRKDPTAPEGVVGTLQLLAGGHAPVPFRSTQELLANLELSEAEGHDASAS